MRVFLTADSVMSVFTDGIAFERPLPLPRLNCSLVFMFLSSMNWRLGCSNSVRTASGSDRNLPRTVEKPKDAECFQSCLYDPVATARGSDTEPVASSNERINLLPFPGVLSAHR